MICSACGTTNEAGRKFCKECGTGLAVACSNCGATNAADAKFCGECGTVLQAGGAPAAARPAAATGRAAEVGTPAAPHSERRLVSVLFADLVGFTTISEGRDPEDTRELLSRYFDLAREVIVRHGGTVEKFIGDAVMAVWGAPIAQEDDAERAVRAALALVDNVKALGPEIQARAGVLTGEAAVNLGAIGEGMVAGDLVNTASRLQSVAQPGTVLVGEATERAANQGIQFEPAGEQVLKGKTAPVPAYRAIRIVGEIGGRNRSEGLEAPFVGRDDEFRLLKDLFHTTSRDKRPRLVSVVGPAGIGKSRLAYEFSNYVDGIIEDTYWHSGRSPSYGEGVTFWALGEMLRRRAELFEGDDEATTRTKISATVQRWVPDEAQQRWVETALLAVLGLGEPPAGGRDELFAACRTFFERIAERGTTVLLFEDLQWADSGLLDFIDHVLDWTKSLPIFVVTLSRPELLERRPDWGAGRRNFVSLALDPLPEAAMNELLDGLVPGLPPAVRRTIVSRADGIPLYAVETVRMLVAEGKLAEKGGVYEPVGDLSAIAIPDTLTALIAARLDGLAPDERAVVQSAAVLGQSFSVKALEALSGVSETTLSPMLAGFIRREIFSVEADPRSPERGQYSFVQALIREVAYNQLARNERKTRHLAAARWFESLGDEELAGVLAEHYAAAHRNAPAGPEADALGSQARIALRAAADRASALGSRAQSVAYLTQALELTSDPAEQALLLEKAGNEQADLNQAAAIEKLVRSNELYRQLGNEPGLARSAVGIGKAMMLAYRADDAVAVLERAVEETPSLIDNADGVYLRSELARAYANSRNPKALELVDRVLEKAEQLNLMPVIAEGLINRALVLGYAGRFYEPVTILRGVLPMTEAHGLDWARTRALNNLSVLLMSEDIEGSLALLEAGMELTRRTGAMGGADAFSAGKIQPLMMLGRWAEAEQLIASLQDVEPDAANSELFQASGQFAAFRGDADRAEQLREISRPLVAGLAMRELQLSQLWVDASISTVLGNLDAGYRHAEKGMHDADVAMAVYLAEWAVHAAFWQGDMTRARVAADATLALKFPGRVFNAYRAQARGAAELVGGNLGDALASYREARGIWTELGLRLNLALMLTDMAAGIGRAHPDGLAAADEARAIWTDLGSPTMLARLDAILESAPAAAGKAASKAGSRAVESSTEA